MEVELRGEAIEVPGATRNDEDKLFWLKRRTGWSPKQTYLRDDLDVCELPSASPASFDSASGIVDRSGLRGSTEGEATEVLTLTVQYV